MGALRFCHGFEGAEGIAKVVDAGQRLPRQRFSLQVDDTVMVEPEFVDKFRERCIFRNQFAVSPRRDL